MSSNNTSSANVVQKQCHSGSALCFQCHRPMKVLPTGQNETFRYCQHCDSGRPPSFEEVDVFVTVRESSPLPGLQMNRHY